MRDRVSRKRAACIRMLVFLLLVSFVLPACGSPPSAGELAGERSDTSLAGDSGTGEIYDSESTVIPAAENTPAPTPEPTEALDVFDMPHPVGVIEYLLPLTLRHVEESSARFHFQLSSPAGGALFIRPAGGGEVLRIPFPQGAVQQLAVEGLQSGEAYEAMVLVGEEGGLPLYRGEAWGPVRFTTADEDDALRVGVIGDASFGDSTTQALVAQLAVSDLDFVIHTGDVVDVLEPGRDPYEEYALGYYLPFAPLLIQMPVYVIPGNHDYDADILYEEAPFYFTAFPPFESVSRPENEAEENIAAYAFNRSGMQFLFLDSQVFYGAEGRAAQDVWMEQRLQDPAVNTTIAIFHIGPYSCSSVHPEDRLAVRDSWVHRLEAGSVPLVLSGHYHGYERAEQNGMTYIISAGGSDILYAQGAWLPQTRAAQRVSHVVIVEMGENGFNVQALSLEGEVIDEVFIPLD